MEEFFNDTLDYIEENPYEFPNLPGFSDIFQSEDK